MLTYFVQRLLLAVVTVWAISVISFAIIQLPPGDFVTAYIAQLQSMGTIVSQAEAEGLRREYGLDRPFPVQYYKWLRRALRGDFGIAMEYRRPVTEVIGDRLALTAVLTFTSIVFTWILAIPIGIYSAVKQYSLGDYFFTLVGFLGLAIPHFLLALFEQLFSATASLGLPCRSERCREENARDRYAQTRSDFQRSRRC